MASASVLGCPLVGGNETDSGQSSRERVEATQSAGLPGPGPCGYLPKKSPGFHLNLEVFFAKRCQPPTFITSLGVVGEDIGTGKVELP